MQQSCSKLGAVHTAMLWRHNCGVSLSCQLAPES